MEGVTKRIKNQTNEQRGGFLGVLLGTLGAILLENMLTGKKMLRAGYWNKKGKGILRGGYGNQKGKGILRAGYRSKMDF